MTNKKTLTIAVISDLHAYDELPENGNKPSHLRITDPEDQPGKHPISGLIKLISEQSLSSTLLLCPGDLGHQAKPAPLKYAWHSLQKIKAALKSDLLIATAGNHDMDSRYTYNSFDAKGVLQALDPPFPLEDNELNDKYWARNFAILQHKNCNIVILNSSAFHGTAPKEIDHGRIADSTLSALEQKLSQLEKKDFNFLLCHHHPQLHMELEPDDYEVMRNGQALLDLLGRGSLGRWIVIHGHKHHPKLTYASGGSTSPVVFSAGSLSASLYLELNSSVRNQFYLIDLPLNEPQLGLAGIIRAWNWTPGLGWSMATPGSGLPSHSGFGFRGDPTHLAQKISNALKGEKSSWKSIRDEVPEVDYVLPQDFLTLKQELETLGLSLQDLNGIPSEIGKKP